MDAPVHCMLAVFERWPARWGLRAARRKRDADLRPAHLIERRHLPERLKRSARLRGVGRFFGNGSHLALNPLSTGSRRQPLARFLGGVRIPSLRNPDAHGRARPPCPRRPQMISLPKAHSLGRVIVLALCALATSRVASSQPLAPGPHRDRARRERAPRAGGHESTDSGMAARVHAEAGARREHEVIRCDRHGANSVEQQSRVHHGGRHMVEPGGWPSTGHSAIYDPLRDRMIVFGGESRTGMDPYTQMTRGLCP